MERGTTSVLKAAVIGFGLVVLAFCVFLLPAGIGSDQTGYYRPILIGIVLTVAPFIVALTASVFQRLVQHAVEIKSENDLTV